VFGWKAKGGGGIMGRDQLHIKITAQKEGIKVKAERSRPMKLPTTKMPPFGGGGKRLGIDDPSLISSRGNVYNKVQTKAGKTNAALSDGRGKGCRGPGTKKGKRKRLRR